MSGIFVAQCIAFASCTILLLLFYVYWNDRRLTQIPPLIQPTSFMLKLKRVDLPVISLNIREVGQSIFDRLSCYCQWFHMYFSKINQLCDYSAVYNLTSTYTNPSLRVQPAAKKAKLKAVCSFFL